MSKSIERVEEVIRSFDLEVNVEHMPANTRTALEAAQAVGCEIGQIVKSLIFETKTGDLLLLLVSGKHTVDVKKFKLDWGIALNRADPQKVRSRTGFAIGGVAPIGHVTAIDTWMDVALFSYSKVWAAAGAPNAVFAVTPDVLMEITRAKKFQPL